MIPVQHHALRVPATTANLGPGFDTFGAAVSMALVARSGPRTDARVTTEGEGAGELVEDDDNLVWRGLVAFCERRGVVVPDVSLTVRNDVPLERGLGSSSAAIVAGLGLARLLTGEPVGDPELIEIAAEIEGHPDNVAPAVLGGVTVSARSDAGRLVVRRAQPSPRLRPLVLVPTARQLTVEARAVIPATLPRGDVATQVARAGHVLPAIIGTWPVDPDLAGDLLHEPTRLAAMPASGALVSALRAVGVHAWLSGAGPSVAAAVAVRDAAAHDRAAGLAEEHGFVLHGLDWDLSGLLPCAVDEPSGRP